MSAPREPEVADALAELVDQFADPLVFLRELVQNSLDAGSPEVDVYCEYRPSDEDPERGVMVIGVDDYGEGMDRVTIDTKLTRLFSSSKDGDLTKIGKFGIGFVSVFALRPEAVCVDTSKGGEHWRILFRADRSFLRIAREQPVDGTKVQVIKAVTRAEYAELSRRAEATLRSWCKHVAGTVRWHDDDIAEPFEIQGALCSVRHEAEGLRVVVGYPADGEGSHGFYNRGLTLLEARGEALVPGVAFKADSRYLEHTLARNDVMRDASFDRVMAVVQRLAEEPLPAALLDAVGRALRSGEAEARPEWLDAAQRALARRVHARGVPPEAPVVRTIDGAPLGLGAVRKAARAGALWVAAERTPLVAAALAAGHVILARPAGATGLDALLLAAVEREVVEAARALVRPEPLDLARARELEPLLAAVQALLRALAIDVAGVAAARLGYPGSLLAGRTLALLPAADALVPWSPELVRPLDRFRPKDVLVLDAEHESLAPLPALARREPEFAAYTLLKLACLDAGGLPVEVDARLCAASAALRAARRERAS